jgi:hypothetical protein
MKQKNILRVIILMCIVISGLAFTAPYLLKANNNCEAVNGRDGYNSSKATQDVMIWHSLYQHLLAFN